MKKEVAIELKGISKSYKLYNSKKDRVKEAFHPLKKRYHRDFFALKNINLSVPKGEILGIVGINGSGKSTLLKIICGVLTPSSGTIHTSGRIIPLLELGAGFNPDFTGYENIYFYSSILGHSPDFIDKCIDDIIDFADIGDFIYQPVKTYSSGMRARLAFSVSVNIQPDILILDEILSVGDELFRKKCFNRMKEFFDTGKTILLVSHSVNTIIQLCTSTIFLYSGEIIMTGAPKQVARCYNKFLFAKQEKRTQMLESMRSGNYSEHDDENLPRKELEHKTASDQNTSQNNTDLSLNRNKIDLEPYYLDSYVSQTVQENRHYNVDITDCHLRTIEGKKVNHLITGRKYVISCRVTFHESFEGIKFGMTVLNERHVKAIGGIEQLKYPVSDNDEILIEWSFDCMLNTGIYYVSLSAWADIEDLHRPLNQMLDCVVFKVLEHNFTYFGTDAIVYLNQKCITTRMTGESAK